MAIPPVPGVRIALDAIKRHDRIRAPWVAAYSGERLGAQRNNPMKNRWRSGVNGQDSKLRSFGGHSHHSGNDIRAAVVIEIHNDPWRPEAEILDLVDCVSARQVDGWVQQPQVLPSVENVAEERRRLPLLSANSGAQGQE
jgi:hypothetical protein